LVQAFLKKWWVESDFKAPNLPLSLRFKVSGCHYVEENIAGLTESDESDNEFDDVLYSLIDGEEKD
jgi:hypothetical protein